MVPENRTPFCGTKQRISTILHADQILVLDDGEIVGKGTHEELMRNCEVYRQIASSQLSEKELGGLSQSAQRPKTTEGEENDRACG